MTNGNLFIVTAASGAGKTSLIKALLAEDAHLKLSISHTTRNPRPSEINGVDYHFVNDATFLRMLGEAQFLESAEVHGARYGTAQSTVEALLKLSYDVILEIDWQGAAQVRLLYPKAISIFVLPPSIDTLERRLNSRGQDSAGSLLNELRQRGQKCVTWVSSIMLQLTMILMLLCKIFEQSFARIVWQAQFRCGVMLA